MKPFIGPQELARRFNEDESVWRRYQQKRDLHRSHRSSGLFTENALDHIDWLEAEQECREKHYIGTPM